MTSSTRTKRSQLLAGVATTVLTSMIGTGAFAADAKVKFDGVTSTDGHKTITEVQGNSNGVSASVINASGGITETGTQTGNSNSVTANTINANATANNVSNFIDLTEIGTLPSDGVASLGLTTNSGAGAAISSSVTASTLQVSLTDFTSGSAGNTGNTISSLTKVNDGSTVIQGQIPNTYASTSTGASSANYPVTDPDALLSLAQASIVASTIQENLRGGHAATSIGDAVTLDLLSTANQTITSGPVLDDNTISSTLSGNSATSTVGVQAGGAPTFNGSAVVSNLQLNSTGAANNSSTAFSINDKIAATIKANDAFEVNTLSGALSVGGNTVSSTITGNKAVGAAGVAGNRILLGGVSFDGAGTAGANAIGSSAGEASGTVTADLVLRNNQVNVGDDTELQTWQALTSGSNVSASVQSLDDGSIDLSGNAVSAAASGNVASSALASGDNAAAFDGTVAAAGTQSNTNTNVSAFITADAVTAATGTAGGVTQDSTVDVSSNSTSASAYGNNQSQNISLAANTLTTGSGNVALTGGTATGENASATGATTITNLQSSYKSDVSATTSGSTISLTADSTGTGTGGTVIKSSGLTTALNSQQAVAVGANGSSSLSLDGTTVGTSAGIASVQTGDALSDVAASLTASSVGLSANADVEGSTLAVTGNLQRAIGYGMTATNTLGVNANQVSIAGGTNVASTVAYDQSGPLAFSNATGAQPAINAGYGVLSDQSIQGDVGASASAGATLSATDLLTDSSASNDSNALVAAAYGNDVGNRMALDVGTLSTTGGYAPVANITSTQAVAGSDVSATATGANVVSTSVAKAVDGSTISTSSNTIQALAYGNRVVGNSLDVNGNAITTGVTSPDTAGGVTATATGSDYSLAADASFSVQSAQSGSGTVLASQLDSVSSPTTAATVRTTLSDNVTDSTVVSEGNASLASATSNRASNGLTIAATTATTTAGVQNFQATDADVSALIGTQGTAGVAGGDFNYTVTGTGLTHDSSSNVLTGGTLYIDTSSLNAAEKQYLLNNGWSTWAPNRVSRVANGYPATVSEYGSIGGSGLIKSATAAGIPASVGQGGVFVALGKDVSNSTVSVSNNTTAGSVTGNSASNALAVDGNEIATASGLTAGTAGLVATGKTGAVADQALSNLQTTGASDLTSTVYGSFAIDAAAAAVIDGSALTISDNTQSSTSVANTATNALALTGNAVGVSTALSSSQSSAAAVSAKSEAGIFAAAAIKDSTLDMSNNTNSALGVINDVTNTLSATATNLATVATVTNPGDVGNVTSDGSKIVGDYVLSNAQTATTSVAGSAKTTLYNEDSIAATTTGLVNGSVTIGGNKTTSEASANRAFNTLSLTASATQGADGGILNKQTSSAAATATAVSNLSLSLNGGASNAALNGSSAAIEGNSTSALARGNYASNVLNSVAGSGYGTSTSPAGSVGATAAIWNSQGNMGAVSATSTNTVYQVALNGSTDTTAAVTKGTVAVSGNQLSAQAFGNSASNSLNLATLSTGTSTAAVGNSQSNSGTVTASLSSATLGISGSGIASGSSLGVGGNTISASAVGNSVSNAIRGIK